MDFNFNFPSFITSIAVVISSAIIWERYQKNKRRKSLLQILIHELWVNLNYVSQIQVSYHNNMEDSEFLHILHYPPRTEVIGKLLEPEYIFSLQIKERQNIVEIFSQLESCKSAFEEWKRAVYSISLPKDSALYNDVYKSVSSTVVSYVKPAMQNMIVVWVDIVNRFDVGNAVPQIKEFKNILNKKKQEKKSLRVGNKASEFRDSPELNKPEFDVLLCWINDWDDCPKEVIEIEPLLALHDSWKRKYVNLTENKNQL